MKIRFWKSKLVSWSCEFHSSASKDGINCHSFFIVQTDSIIIINIVSQYNRNKNLKYNNKKNENVPESGNAIQVHRRAGALSICEAETHQFLSSSVLIIGFLRNCNVAHLLNLKYERSVHLQQSAQGSFTSRHYYYFYN